MRFERTAALAIVIAVCLTSPRNAVADDPWRMNNTALGLTFFDGEYKPDGLPNGAAESYDFGGWYGPGIKNSVASRRFYGHMDWTWTSALIFGTLATLGKNPNLLTRQRDATPSQPTSIGEADRYVQYFPGFVVPRVEMAALFELAPVVGLGLGGRIEWTRLGISSSPLGRDEPHFNFDGPGVGPEMVVYLPIDRRLRLAGIGWGTYNWLGGDNPQMMATGWTIGLRAEAHIELWSWLSAFISTSTERVALSTELERFGTFEPEMRYSTFFIGIGANR